MVNLLVDIEEGLERFSALQGVVAAAVSRAVERTGGPEKAQIGLLVVGEEAMRDFNLEHRGQDRPTDVLSFPLLEAGEEITQADIDPQTGEVVLGDIVLSLPAAERQAAEYGHSLAREAAYLAVHGTLHLLGYDHENGDEGKLMRKLEEAVLEAAGLAKGASAV
jgi:probable rRNA maturation factor